MADIRSLARAHTREAVQILAGIARNSDSDSARVAAVGMLMDRGWGKAAQIIAGDEDGGPLVINIVHRVRDDMKQPGHQPGREISGEVPEKPGSVPTSSGNGALRQLTAACTSEDD